MYSCRIEMDYAVAVKPHRTERRTTDGRLIKTVIFRGDREDVMHDAAVNYRALTADGDGHMELLEVRGYDGLAYLADPIAAVPEFKATTI